MKTIDPKIISDYARDGAVCLRNFLSPEEIEILKRGIEKNLADPSPLAKIASLPTDSGRFFEDFRNWQKNEEYREIIFKSGLAAAAGALTDSQAIRLYHDHLLVKETNTQQRTPWHQDQPYYNVEGKKNCSFWIPVDPVSRESTLEFIAGSHRGPWLMPRTFKDAQAKWFPEGSLQDLPDIESSRAGYPILGWDLEPGDVVCFHMLTLHAAGGVSGQNRRRAFSVRFLGDDMTFAPRHWVTSPPFMELDSLRAGAPLDHPLFPIVWKRD